MEPSSSSEERKSIAAHLEAVIRGGTSSINDRTFDLAPAWSFIADNFEVTHDTGSRPATHSKAELLQGFKSVCEEFPEYRLEIFSCNVEVDWGNGKGQVFVNASESGGPGVPRGLMARKHIAVFDFARDERGIWMAVREATIFGLEVDVGGGIDGMGMF